MSARSAGRRSRGQPLGTDAVWTLAGVVAAGYALLPVVWIVMLSLKTPDDVLRARFLPTRLTAENFRAVFADDRFLAALRNSVGISALATTLAVAVATAMAYAVVRLEVPGRRVLLATTLAIAMFPQAALVGPLFEMWRGLGLYDTWLGLIVPYLTFALPLAVWTMAAYLRQLPWELEQAALTDGATRGQAFRAVVMPLAAPGVVTTAILVFLHCWNDFLFAISLTSTDRARTVPATLAFFSGATRFQSPVGPIAAASVVVTVPVVLLVLLFQRRIVAGLTSGAVKG